MLSSAKSFAHKAGHRLERGFDRTWLRVKKRFGWLDPVTIQPFRGYGDGERMRSRARVLEETRGKGQSPDNGSLDNLIAMFHRFESDEIGGAKVKASYGGQDLDLTSDGEGYIEGGVHRAQWTPSRSADLGNHAPGTE